MHVINRLRNAGVVPVVVLENAANAVPAAQAMLEGGVDVMEITLRTPVAIEAIRAVSQQCPDILVGAGTVLSEEQARAAVEAGAQFIVSPGFDEQVVDYCLKRGITVIPGCVTPTEITRALAKGLHVLKFFPANVYGGLPALKALAAPFGNIRFIPTGGIGAGNLSEYVAEPFVHAVGGSWLCAKADISAGNYARITALCKEARGTVLGYCFAHMGINTPGEDAALELCGQLGNMFGFETRQGGSSIFSSTSIEVMKSRYRGQCGHIAIWTNDIDRAIADLAQKGYVVDIECAKYKGTAMIAVYLKDEIGGFAVHLLQK